MLFATLFAAGRPVAESPVRRQEPFSRVAPLIGAALLLGAGGGFVLAAVLTTTRMAHIPAGLWWVALAQAHGHLQLYGWAGLFVLGVALHFLPRLRGTPLALPRLVPWLLGAQAAAVLLRSASQPLAVVRDNSLWRGGLVVSGLLEAFALLGAVVLVVLTLRAGPALASRPALRGVLPFFVIAFTSLGLAALVNLGNVVRTAALAVTVVPATGDDLNVTLGLLGFLVPMVLAMSARSLPMYAGLEAFPQRLLWPLAGIYGAGLALAAGGSAAAGAAWGERIYGAGLLVVGAALVTVVATFMRMMRARGRLPRRVAELAPRPEDAARGYRSQVSRERNAYGPFVALVASAYLWAALGGVLLVLDGAFTALGVQAPVTLDAPRHSLAVGFIALLICGIAPRMLPGFSGGRILSPKLVSATLWLGNAAAILRVGSLLAAPALDALGSAGSALDTVLFGLSGPFGLALAICLAVNLWPALRLAEPRAAAAAGGSVQ